ncbi:MAG TPA: FMN-binding negative transcriptional regulator [Hyphomicrobiaceae bacterium]|nr:FMN-binding negative transcriptional regulator [Hyphomicrobiaceae bacterium]
MYLPDHFREDKTDAMHALMRAAPFAVLVTAGASGPEATHMPTVLANEPPLGAIEAHMARANPHWKTSPGDADALVIFSGPDHYIRPGWYPSKADGGKAVPTWNYAAVHAYGRLEVIKDQDWLRQHVGELSAQQERGTAQPWSIEEAPEDYLRMMLRGIIGVRMVITRLEGKWKMSQNRNDADRAGVLAGLEREGTDKARAVARLVRARIDRSV